MHISANTAVIEVNVKTKREIIMKGTLWTPNLNDLGMGYYGYIDGSTRKSEHGPGPGAFSDTLRSLTPGTTYYLFAYAIDETGYPFFSERVSFKTLDNP